MRYVVTARVRPGREDALAQAIDQKRLGRGSVAGDEYIQNMHAARHLEDGTVKWVEVCFCPTPLEEERPYWEEYFTLLTVKDAHVRSRCRDVSGEEPWACCECDCTRRLERSLRGRGTAFLETLRPLRPAGPASNESRTPRLPSR